MAKPRRGLRRLLSCFFPCRRSRDERTMDTGKPRRGLGRWRDERKMVENTQLDGNLDGVSVSLPEDIIFDVLSRLPVKSLYRFRCVSKGWHALISDPAFATAQSSHAITAARPLIVGVFGKPWQLVNPSLQPPSQFELRIMDTADGSVLKVVKGIRGTKLAATSLDLVFIDHGMYGSMVIDPATGREITIAGLKSFGDDSGFSFPFEYCRSSFGRATPSAAYKVVRLRGQLFSTPEHRGQRIEVATLRDAAEPTTWRQRPAPPVPICDCSGCKATVNGVLHFMHAGTHGATKHSGCNRMAAFDLESEQWKTMIDGPPIGCRPGQLGRLDRTLRELKGTLSVVETVAFYDHLRYINICCLVDSTQSIWVKECTIQMDQGCFFFKALETFEDERLMMLSAFRKESEKWM